MAGAGLPRIAAAKAGILKPGRALVLAEQSEPDAEATVLQHAEQLYCPVTRAQDAVTVKSLGLQSSHGQWRQQVQVTAHQGLDGGLQQWSNGNSEGHQKFVGWC